MNGKTEVSAIIPVGERYDNVRELYYAYKRALDSSGYRYEMVYVIDGDFPDIFDQLKSLQQAGEQLRIIKLAKEFGEATALSAGFENSTGDIILTLTAYYQVEPSELTRLLSELEGHDMVVGRRWPRTDFWFNRLQARVFNWMLNFITGSRFQDLGCGIRAFRRQVAAEVLMYGDQNRFFPILVSHRGFRVREVDVAQSAKENYRRVYSLGLYARQALDILAVFFLVKFTKKPLRFFGMIGTITLVIGGVFLTYIVIERLLFGVSLAERPALLLSSLLVVLGVQILALGLIGELIIFTHAKELKEYTIDEIIN